MSVTLRDPTAHLLDLPPQPLGPEPLRESHGDSRGSTLYTDRGRGEFTGTRREPTSSSLRGSSLRTLLRRWRDSSRSAEARRTIDRWVINPTAG